VTTTEIIILLITGLVAGVLGGALGFGGGLIFIPALVLFFGFSQHMAQGTSLFIMLPPIGILAVMQYYKAGQVNIKYGLILIITYLIGSYFGSSIALKMPESILKKAFAVIFILIGLKMFSTK